MVILLCAFIVFSFVIGVYGIQGKDKCAHTLSIIFKKPFIDTISGFDIVVGTDIFFFGILILFTPFMFAAGLERAFEVMGAIWSFITIVLLIYSFYMTKPIYGSYNSWKREIINCSSPIFYTAFAYLTIQYTVIGLLIIGCLAYFVCIFVYYGIIMNLRHP